MKTPDATHKIGDRVIVLHNIPLGNLIGTVKAIHERPRHVVYDVALDGGGTDSLYGFQLQPLPESEGEADAPADGKPEGQEENAGGEGPPP